MEKKPLTLHCQNGGRRNNNELHIAISISIFFPASSRQGLPAGLAPLRLR